MDSNVNTIIVCKYCSDEEGDEDEDEEMDTAESAEATSSSAQPRNPDDEFNFDAYDDEGKHYFGVH